MVQVEEGCWLLQRRQKVQPGCSQLRDVLRVNVVIVGVELLRSKKERKWFEGKSTFFMDMYSSAYFHVLERPICSRT